MRITLLVVLVLLIAPFMLSQTVSSTDINGPGDTGLPANAFISGSAFDNVRINNGNLHIEIPVTELAQRGEPLIYKYVYDSKGWIFFPNPNVHPPQGPVGAIRPGVDPQFRYVGGPTHYSVTYVGISTTLCGYGGLDGTTPLYSEQFGNYTLIEADGTKHPFGGVWDLFTAPDVNSCPSTAPGTTLYSTDGSGWILHIGVTANDLWPVNAIRRDGTVINFVSRVESNAVDRNGNIFTANTDTLGRALPTGAAYNDSSGTLQSLLITNVQVPVQTALCGFYHLGTNKCQESTIRLSQPSIIQLPNGLKYQFTYEQNQYGEPTSVILPTGAQISWTWGNLDSGGRKVTSRTVTTGGNSFTWKYTYGYPPSAGNQWVNSIVDPLGNETDYTCQYLFVGPGNSDVGGDPGCTPVKVKYYQGSASTGTLLKTVDTQYLTTGAILPTVVTTTLNPQNLVSKVETDWDAGPEQPDGPFRWSNPVERREFGYGAGSPGGLIRRTDYNYLHLSNPTYKSLNLADFPTNVTVYDGGGNIVSQTKTGYDETAVAATSGTPSHDYAGFGSGNNIRANATSVSHWRNTDGAWITTSKKFDDLGNVISSTDPLNHITTYSYDDNWATSPANACVPATVNTRALLTKVTNAIQQTGQTSYYPCTGLVYSRQDQNDITAGRTGTSHTYDFINRPLTVVRPDGGQTTFDYHADALPYTVTRTVTESSNSSIVTSAVYDGLGREVQTQLNFDPLGSDIVDITYDALGRKSTISNPHRSTAASTDGITTYQYDTLGRVTQVAPPDGTPPTSSTPVTTCLANNVCTQYKGNATTVTDQAGKQRGSINDALGRLVEVDEPAASGVLQANNIATLQPDGNFVVSNPVDPPLWFTGTSGTNASSIFMQDDGNLVLYIFKWSAGVYAAGSPGPFPASSCSIGAYLISGQTLPSGKCIVSPHGQYFLYMSPDGNFYIYDWAHATGTWGPGTQGHPGAYATLQTDGNLVVFDVNGVALWSSGTGGTFAERLNLEDDGRIIIYRSAWNSGTSTGQFNWSQLPHPGCDVGIGTGTTGILGPGQCFVSPNGHFELLLQADGNLVIYDLGATPPRLLWGAGSNVTAVDPSVGMRTLYTYDTLGNLTCVEQHGNAASGTGCSASPSSDASSPWRVRRFTYDSLSRLLTAKNPESGTLTYAYDNNGNLLQKTSPAPNQTGAATQTISYCYDALSRVTGKGYGTQSCPLTSPVVTYSYDAAAEGVGHLTSLTDQAGTGAYTYDLMGRVATETRTLTGANNAAISKKMSYAYDLAGSVTSMTYPSGAVVNYTADSAGRMLSAVDSANGINYVTGATYGPDSSLTGFVSGNSGTFAGITNAFSYNKRLQPLTMSATAPSQTVFSIGYDFHLGNGTTGSDNGNVWGIYNYRDRTRDQAFTYDALNRLTSAQNAGTDCNVNVLGGNKKFWGNTYGYDAWGNLTNKTKISTACAGENLGINVDVTNRLLSGYLYDAAGNMTHDATSGLNYTFDQENRITGANGYTYTYDGDGNRVSKSNGTTGTLYWYMAPGVVAETDLGGTLKSEYVFFDGERVARKDFPGSTVAYYFSDHLKTASVITDSAGNITAESDYYPWGGELQFVNNDYNHYKYGGHEHDNETGLEYYGARYYSNPMGRWLSPDWSSTPVPVPYADFGNPQSLNQYGFVGGNPASKADPDGHDWPSWHDAVDFVGGTFQGIVSSASWGAVGAPSSNDSTASLTGQLLGTAIEGGVSTDMAFNGGITAGVGLVAEVPSLGTSTVLVVAGAAAAGVGTYGAVGAAKNSGAILNAMSDKTSSRTKTPYENTPENQAKMKDGNAPTGTDGHPVELHHEGQNPKGPVKEMTRTDHRLGDNFKKNHSNTGQESSQIDRNKAQGQKKAHWKNKADEK